MRIKPLVVRFVVLLPVAVVMLATVASAPAGAAEPPVKQIVTGYYGWEVDKTHPGPICLVESGDECQPATPSSQPGGFEVSVSVGGGRTPEGNVYVLDRRNHRVQELSATGPFIAMFGWDVNATKVKEGAPQNERNVCTRESGDTCQAGTEGANPGQFSAPISIAVDPIDDSVYVAELVNGSGAAARVQKFTAAGAFAWELGREVNEDKGNLCTASEIAKCKGPRRETIQEYDGPNTGGPGAFHLAQFASNLLAVGGPEDLLYVGDQNAVQEFKTDGTWTGEPLTKSQAITHALTGISSDPQSYVRNVAVDKAGDAFVVYAVGAQGQETSIHEFDPSGSEIHTFVLSEGASVKALAFDPTGRLAVSESVPVERSLVFRGSLYEVAGSRLHLLTRFPSHATESVAFNGNGLMFAAIGFANPPDVLQDEVVAYKSVVVAELSAAGSIACGPGATLTGADVTLNCGLAGEVNPWGVSETEAWFQWGTTPTLGFETAKRQIATGSSPVSVSASLEGLRPDAPLYYQLAGTDHVVQPPELLTSEPVFVTTPTVPPRVVGEPSVSFVHATTADMYGHVNPENAQTEYEFQYAPAAGCATLEEACPGLAQSKILSASDYASVSTTLEVSGLQPASAYRYRLFATNQKGQGAVNETGGLPLPEGMFTTLPAPVPRAVTGPASLVGSTTAVISGMADPDGQDAAYAFEMGPYNGSETLYETVYTASAGHGTGLVSETFGLSGLQPGATYAYRIKVWSGYGTAYGQPATFTTEGLPSVLSTTSALPLLGTPSIQFPAAVPKTTPRTISRRCKKGIRNKHGKCAKTNTHTNKRARRTRNRHAHKP